MHYTIEKINGIDTIFAPTADSHSVTVQILVKAGSIYENKQNNGISHFLEHMFFKGGVKYPSAQAAAIAVDRFGGESNAFTGDEYAGYYIQCGPEFIYDAIDVLGDMMTTPSFPAEEIEKEKGVVLQEIKMYQDAPRSQVMRNRQRYYYGDNSHGRAILGTEDTVKSITQDDLFAHKESLYTQDNMVVVIAGAILDKDAVATKLSECLKVGEHKTKEAPSFIRTPPAQQRDSYHKGTEQNHLIMSMPGFSALDDTKYAAGILTTLLGGNMSSKLFQHIREEEGLCYYIGGSHHAETGYGDFVFRAGMDKSRFDFAIKRMYEELQKVAEGQFTREEVERAIGYCIGQTQMSIEGPGDLADFLGMQRLLYKRIRTIEEVVAIYKTITFEQVQAVAPKVANSSTYLYYVE